MNNRIESRIDAILRLPEKIRNSAEWKSIKETAEIKNPWFTQRFIDNAVDHILNGLQEQSIRDWVAGYPITQSIRNVGIVMAGNIPLVGFHDFLCVYLSGHNSFIKLSEKDAELLPFITSQLDIEQESIKYVDRLKNIDAVIATGSNNTARYFDYYFGKYPNIIRKNRNAVAVIDGTESDEDLMALGEDVFTYYGLGCRNVSKLYLPENYPIERLMSAWENFSWVNDHNKYRNNYDYNFSIFLLNRVNHYTNEVIVLKEDPQIASRIASIHFEYYMNKGELIEEILNHDEQIQCLVGNLKSDKYSVVPFGQAQKPGWTDYADGIDTMKFLTAL
jgi:hypothetical protein